MAIKGSHYPHLPRQYGPSLTKWCHVDGILGALELTEETTLTISKVFDECLFLLLIHPYYVLRADQLAHAASIAPFLVNPANPHDRISAII